MIERPPHPPQIFEEEVSTPGTPFAAPPPGRITPAAFAALIVGNAFLACGPWLVRLAEIGPVASGFWRLALSLPFLILITLLTGRRADPKPGGRPGIAPLLLLCFAGLCFAFDLAAWHTGIVHTRLANSALFGNVSSLIFAAYGFLLARSWPRGRQAIALLLAIGGVLLLVGRSYRLSAEHLGGDLLCLLAGVFYSGYMVAIERVRGRMTPWPMLAIATTVAATALLPLAIWAGGPIVPHRWEPLLALAIGSQVIGQGLLVYTLRVAPPLAIGLGQLTQPVIAAAIGWIAFHEHLTLPDVIGAVMIASALVLIRQRS